MNRGAKTVYQRQATTFRELMAGEYTATIHSLTTGEVVRRLRVGVNQDIEVDALTEKVTVPLDTVITYEPWELDRGSLLFQAPGIARAKLATEFDTIKFVNGYEFALGQPRALTEREAEEHEEARSFMADQLE